MALAASLIAACLLIVSFSAGVSDGGLIPRMLSRLRRATVRYVHIAGIENGGGRRTVAPIQEFYDGASYAEMISVWRVRLPSLGLFFGVIDRHGYDISMQGGHRGRPEDQRLTREFLDRIEEAFGDAGYAPYAKELVLSGHARRSELDVPALFMESALLLSLAIAGITAPVAVAGAWRTRRRPGRCSSCGYDLAGLRTARCPECGEVRGP